MQTYTYVSKGKFELMEKPKPVLMDERDAIVKVTLASICSSDLHIGSAEVTGPIPVSSFLKKLGFKPFFSCVKV